MRTKYNKKKSMYEFKEYFELSRFYLRDVKYNPFMASGGLCSFLNFNFGFNNVGLNRTLLLSLSVAGERKNKFQLLCQQRGGEERLDH